MKDAAIKNGSKLSGTIYLDNGNTIEFQELTSLIFSLEEGAESIPQNVSEWPVYFDEESVSRSIPLSWVKSIEVIDYETRGLYRCLFNPVVSITNLHDVQFQSRYKTLEWIMVKIADQSSGGLRDIQVFFADSGTYLQKTHESRINIRKIVFNTTPLLQSIER